MLQFNIKPVLFCTLLGGIILALSVNAFYYSRFKYELNVAIVTNTAILCAIANETLKNFTCPKPLYYDTYTLFANELKSAYRIIVPLDVVTVSLILLIVFGLFINKLYKNRQYEYVQL